MTDDVREVAAELKAYATHFEHRDWNYTRHHNLKHVRRKSDYSGYDHPWQRVKRWADDYLPGKRTSWLAKECQKLAWRHPWIHLRASLQTERNLPDGMLDSGNILVFWEEVAEYLQYVQPSVGELLADLMDRHPELPEVQAIAAEMKRIQDAYDVRIKNGEVD